MEAGSTGRKTGARKTGRFDSARLVRVWSRAVKLPPSSPPPDSGGAKKTYDKDKTATRRMVAGAAGGMLGVDYEDSRRADPNTKAKPPKELPGTTDRRMAEKQAQIAQGQAQSNRASEKGELGVGRDEAYVVRPEEDAPTKEKKKKPRHIARDRFQVDKDAPELVRTREWDSESEEERRDPDEQELELADWFSSDSVLPEGGPSVSRAHLFDEDRKPEPGDPSLRDPESIQRALGAPASYAKHVMILAEAFRRTTGATRSEALSYLGAMFVGLKDRSFGRLALKEFGPSTGILDIYPLEVMEHVLENHPGYLPKAGFGTIFRKEGEERRKLVAKVDEEIVLEYPESLKVRGFALKGGGCPGYVFEPGAEPGQYRLVFSSAGRFDVLLSATNRAGYTMIDRLEVEVEDAKGKKAPSKTTALAAYPERDESRVARWPWPEVEPLDPRALLEEAESAVSSRASPLMTAAELAWRQTAAKVGEGNLAAGPFRVNDDSEEAEGEDTDVGVPAFGSEESKS